MKIGLLAVDSNYPNIALMKISAYHKAEGDAVEWYNPLTHYDKVYAAKVFSFTPDYGYYIHADEVEKGGTGYDLQKALPPEIDRLQPDYGLYLKIDGKTAYGFLTRGCPNRCRWCCAEYKEVSGVGKVTLIGIRKQESARRSKREEVSSKIKGRRAEQTFDQWSEHEEKMVTCVGGKDKILVSPIIYWTERDVWEFLNDNGIPHCELYDQGYTRIGCICCPMSKHKQKIRDIERWPHVKRNWLKTIQWLKDNGYNNHHEESAETNFRWWISGQSFKEFYADNVLQQKIEFNNE